MVWFSRKLKQCKSPDLKSISYICKTKQVVSNWILDMVLSKWCNLIEKKKTMQVTRQFEKSLAVNQNFDMLVYHKIMNPFSVN